MGIESPLHLLFILAVALVVLGPKRLPELARAIGKGVREFRGAMDAAQTEPSPSDHLAQASPSDHLAQGEPAPSDQLAQGEPAPSDHLAQGEPAPSDQLAQGEPAPSDHLAQRDLGELGAPGEPAHVALPADAEVARDGHAAS